MTESAHLIERLRSISDPELLSATQLIAQEERRITLSMLYHLKEVERRRLYAVLGYSSLFEYTVSELRYSESSAFRRISSMRTLNEFPDLEKKLESGELSITGISQVQAFIRNEERLQSRTYSKGERIALFKKTEGKTSREITRELIQISPISVLPQRERPVSEDRTEIRFLADQNLMGKFTEVRNLGAHSMKDPGSYPELMNLMSDTTLMSLKKKKGLLRDPDLIVAHSAPQPTQIIGYSRNSSRFIPAEIRRQIWREAKGQCQYQNPDSRKRCSSKFALEIDHCEPVGQGGAAHHPKNLRLLCRAHNQRAAIESFGVKKMEPYLSPQGS